MKNLLIYPDVLHLADVGHLKVGKILSLAIFLMVLFASGQQAKSEVKLTRRWHYISSEINEQFTHLSHNDSIFYVIGRHYPYNKLNVLFLYNTFTGEILKKYNFYYDLLRIAPNTEYVYGIRTETSDTNSKYFNIYLDFLDIDSFKVYQTTKINLIIKIEYDTYEEYIRDIEISHDRNTIALAYNGVIFVDTKTGEIKSKINKEHDLPTYIDLWGFTNNDRTFYFRESIIEPHNYGRGLVQCSCEGDSAKINWTVGDGAGRVSFFENGGKFFGDDYFVYFYRESNDNFSGYIAQKYIIIKGNAPINETFELEIPLNKLAFQIFAISPQSKTLAFQLREGKKAKYLFYDLERKKYLDSTAVLDSMVGHQPDLFTSDEKNVIIDHGLYSIDGLNSISITDNIIELYPNPTTNEVKITFENLDTQNVKIDLFDINGNLMKILSNQIELQGQLTKSFNMNSLMNGTYFIKVESKVNNYTFKVIKL